MRVAISGSRGPDPSRGRPFGWTDYDFVAKLVKRLLRAGDTINVGDAPSGVDFMVAMASETEPWADEFPSSSVNTYEARWKEEGSRAGHNRNDWMISESDFLIALFGEGGPTPGTLNAIECAKKRGVPFMVYQQGGWR